MTTIQFQCTDQLKEYVVERANDKKLTISAYIINLIMKDLVEKNK